MTPPDMEQGPSPLADVDYERLAEFRYLLRHFLIFSENAAVQAGLTAQQHQALLAVKGSPGRGPVTTGELGRTACHTPQ